MSKKFSLDDINLNDYDIDTKEIKKKKKQFSLDDIDLNDYDIGVDDKYISTFISDSQSYLKSQSNRTNSYKSGISAYDDFINSDTRNDLNTRANNIRVYLNANKNSLDSKAYSDVMSYLDGYKKDNNTLLKSFRDSKTHYSQWKTEDDYNFSVNNNKNVLKYSQMSLDDLKKEKEEYDKVKKDVNFSKYSKAFAPSGNPQGEAISGLILGLMDEKNQNKTDYDSHKKWEQDYKDKAVLYYDSKGNAVTYESLIRDKEHEQIFEDINGDTTKLSAYVNAQEAQKKVLELDKKYQELETQKMVYQTNGFIPDAIIAEQQSVSDAINQQKAIIEDFNSLGYDFDELQHYNRMMEDREAEVKKAEEAKKYAEEHEIMATFKSMLSTPMMIGEYIGNLVDSAQYGYANVYDDKYTNQSQVYQSTVANIIDDAITNTTNSEFAGWLASTAYSGVTSAAQSAMLGAVGTILSGGNVAVGTGAALSIMGTQAAASSFNTSVRNGSTSGEAISFSLASGIGEALFEKLPLDNIFKLAKGAGKTATKEGIATLLKGLVKQSAIEGLEEGGTELWNAMADAIINGDHSAYNIAVDKYLKQGYSESDAKKMASTDWLGELISSMVGGFIGGGVTGSAVGVPSFAINQEIQNAQYDALGKSTIQNENVQGLVEDAQSLVTEGEKNALNKLANKVAGVENVDNLSKRQSKKYTRNVGKLVDEVASAKLNSIESAQTEAIKHELESNGVENVSQATNIVVKKLKGQSLTKAETEIFESVDGNTIIDSVKNLDVKSAVDKDNLKRTEDALKKTGELVFKENKSVYHKKMVEESGYTTTEGKTTVDATGVEVDSMIIDSLDGEDISLKVNMGEDSAIVLAGELNLNDNYAVMLEGLKRIGKKFNLSTSSANKLLALYESYNGDAFTFYKAMEAGVSYGHYNIREYFNNNEFVKDLPQEYQEKLYEIGRENVQKNAEEKQALVELEGTTKATGKVTFAEDVKYHKLNKHQKAQVDFSQVLAKTFGFDLEIFQSPKNAQGKSIGENGSYSANANLMRLDIDAGTIDGKSLILFTQSHELTHFIQKWSPEKYKVFADFLMEKYAKSDVPVQKLIEQKIEESKISAAMDKSGKHHVLTESEAFDEIVANACEDFLADPNIQQTILEIAEIDQSIAQKIKNFIKNLVARIEKALRGLQGQSLEAGFVRELDMNAIQELKDLWMEALKDARENVLEARERTAEEQQAIEEFGDDLGSVETNEDGDVTLITNEDNSTLMYSERTWLNGGKDALISALIRNEHTQEEINDTVAMVEDTLDYLKILAAGDAQMRGYKELADNLLADITTDIKGKKQVLHAIVNNGDYPVNIDLALICKKRVAYMNVMTRLIADGVMENVKYDGDAIAEVNAILRKNGFETACLGCFVESRRLQFQTWAETIVQEWNGEVDKRNKNAGSFNYTKSAFTDANSLTEEELNTLEKELSGKKKNKQGNLNLGQGSAITRMGKLLDSAPTLQKHISVSDLLTPEGLTKLRAENPNLFSIVKSRYGAATPKIVQKYNPYASELANLTFKSVSDITTNAVGGSQEYLAEAKKELASSKPSLPKGMKASAFNKTKEMKDWNAKVETLAMRKYLYDIGGARMQSFSDFMIENVFDYMQIFADLAANKFPLHSYTKEIAFLRLFGMTGAKINGSLIAHVDKSFSKRYAGLLPVDEVKKGNAILVHTEDGDFAIGFDDYSRHIATKGTDGETFIQSIGMKDIIALQMDKRYTKNIGSITIGVSDVQILAMLDSPLFRMVIPYHSSGMLPQFAKLVGVDMYNDYTDYQNTTVKQYYDLNKNPLPDEVDDKGKTKLGTFKKANGKSINADTSYSFNAELQKIGDPKTVADNYIAWCNEFHEVYDGKTMVGYAKFNPKFSNSPYGTDFTKHENYYKLLEDFNVYDGITEQYASQGAVEMIFPSAENRLSAAEMEEYKQRLRDTGIFTEKEIEKYAKKADITFEELLKAEVKNRIAYQDEQNPKWESTIKEIEDELKGKYSREDKPVNAYSYDWQHQDRNDWNNIKTIQGLESYSIDEVVNITKEHINNILSEYGEYADIVAIRPYGSRAKGTAKNESDLDIVVQYEGDIREDDMFNMLNDEDAKLYIEGIEVDINPIKADDSGSVEEYFNRVYDYDKYNDNHDTKFQDRDSTGRELSPEQVEFFKDSKVRDAEGRLLKMYHSSVEDFTVFDKNKIRKTDYDASFNGFWFSNKENTSPAMRSGNYLKTGYLRIDNPAPLKVWRKVTKEVRNSEPKFSESRSAHDEVRYRLQEMGYDGIHWDGVPEVDWDKLDKEGYVEFKDVRGYEYALKKTEYRGLELLDLIDLHYDYGEVVTGYKDRAEFERLQEEVWVAFEPNQFKNADNLNPTESDDIRYSDREVAPIEKEDYKKLKSFFGTTNDFNVAGYMLQDGYMLDFSGKHWGDKNSKFRQVDHRDVLDAFGYDGVHSGRNGVNAMIDMISNGNIRLMPETAGINLAKPLTKAQRTVLSRYINYFKGEVVVDIDEVGGDTIHSFQYNKGTSHLRVLKDLDAYFKDGTLPASQSNLAQFREFADSDIQFSLREEAPPVNTVKGYKVFVVKDGKLYPPMVANPNGADTPVGVWLNADIGASAPDSKTGRKQVKAGGKGTQGGSGSLAFRPGWHLGEVPIATQFDRLNPETGVKELFPENFVWAECDVAADYDYQEEAMSYGYTENGKFRHSYAGLPRLPVDGYYKYRTNPNPNTVAWLITGAMKVNRVLSDAEVAKILRENNIEPPQRQGGEKTLKDLGLERFEDIQYQDRYIRYGKLTQNRIDYLINDSGAGSRVDYANTWIASISPSDFINLTLPYETREKGREVFDTEVEGDYGSVMGDRDYVADLQNTRQMPYLVVDMDTGKVTGHNGRHRMRALEMAGASRTPIGIKFYKDGYLYKGNNNGERLESIDVQRLTSQFDDKFYLQYNAYIHNIIPLNEDHRAEIEKEYRVTKFEKEHFDVLAYQDRPLSNREILVDALSNSDELSIEDKNRLEVYGQKIEKINEYEKELSDLGKQIHEIITTSGSDRTQLNALYTRSDKLRKKISRVDGELLNIEAMQPVKKLVEIRKKQILKSYKETVKEQRISERDRKSRTVMKNKIKGVVRELNSILSKGSKEKNVKIPIQPAVMKALELAEFLFDDDLSAKFILTQANIDVREEEMKDVEKYRYWNNIREEHMKNMLSLMDKEGTESQVANLKDTISEIERKMGYLEKKLSSLITNEKKKLNQGGVGEAVKALAEAYSQLQNSQEDYVKAAYNEGVYNYIKGLADRLAGAKVKEMSADQMYDVYTAFKAVLTTVRQSNKLFINGKREDVQKMSSSIMMEISLNKKTKTVPYEKLDALKGKMLQYSWNELKPFYAFQRIGSSILLKLYESARQGEDVLGRDYQEAIEFAEKIKKKYGYDSWDMDEKYDIKLEDGRTFTLTLQEIMSIYAYSKREQAYDHMMFGGFVFNNKKFFKT
jgi:predicted nucleotidyltransferase